MSPVSSQTNDVITKEYRVAVVMYGGISLAIYMNGIAQELLAMVRSTAVEDRTQPGSQLLTDLKGTEAIYRELALLLSDEKDGNVHTRFVIDIISGTSAGGINGVFLAKALARRKDMQSLKRTWVEEGDFQKLLNDQALGDIGLQQQVPPRSLLNGERMYVKLFEAFAEMDANPGQSYVDELELSVTTTDLRGKVVPLRLADRVVWERKYKQVFHLRYSEDPKTDDFEPENTPFLAFAARCTSSFPVAFEPMQLASIPRLVRASGKYREDHNRSDDEWRTLYREKWQRFFGPSDKSAPDSERFFADGGYLDNHPFDHAIESLARQSSAVRSERKLLYIEPSPQHPERQGICEDKNGKLPQPDAIENAWDGLAGIPDQQPIGESLLQIQHRNRLIRKINNVVSEITEAVEHSQITHHSQTTLGHTVQSGESVEPLGPNRPGLQAYTALNVYAVTDNLALLIARFSGIDDDSDYVYAIRCLVKVWRKEVYEDKDGQFLLDFDVSYRLRKFQFVRSQLDMLSCLDEDAKRRLAIQRLQIPASKEETDEFRKHIAYLRGVLDESFRQIRKASRLAEKNEDIATKIGELKIGSPDLNDILGVGRDIKTEKLAPLPVIDDREYEVRAQKLLDATEFDRKKTLRELQAAITNHYRAEMSEARTRVVNVLTTPGEGPDSPMRTTVFSAAKTYFYGFQEFDAAIFPITYGTDAGELVPVDVVRVSPEDAIAIQDESKTNRPKLAGASFGAFGAFLERVWRTNDILWGRLDGAERIIRALAVNKPEADDLIKRAHDRIIAEELTPANEELISQMLVEALLRTGSDGELADDRGQKMIAEVEECVRAESGSTDINPKLLAVLRQALTADRLRKALETFEISREPNRKDTLENVARSARIVGRILDDIGRARPLLKKPGGILIQAGSVLWGLVEVATPGSIWGSFFAYWFGLLMLFSATMIVGGTIFSQPAQALGFRLLVLALAVRLTMSVMRTYIRGDKRWQRVLEGLFIVGLLVILGLGLIELRSLYVSGAQFLRVAICKLVQCKP